MIYKIGFAIASLKNWLLTVLVFVHYKRVINLLIMNNSHEDQPNPTYFTVIFYQILK